MGRFHTTTAQLVYLCERARLDVQLPVLFMCTRVREANVKDKQKPDRIMGYLKSNLNRRRRILNTMGASRLGCYIDASFSSHLVGKGHSRMMVMWGNTCIMVKCCKQKMATKNSTESELVGTSDCYEDLE